MPLPPAHGMYDPSLERDACGLGFIADLRRPPSHDVVQKGVEILRRLAHRGAAGCDPCTSDGAGILLHIPLRALRALRSVAPESSSGTWATTPLPSGFFLARRRACARRRSSVLEDAVRHHNQKVIGWRDVPVDVRQLGPVARSTMPVLRQLFIGRMCPVPAFERTLFMIRKRASRRATEAGVAGFYIASLSSRTVVYKGLSLPERLDSFYLDLREEETKSKFALVHSRFMQPTRSRRGSARTRTAASLTTAKSIRSAATITWMRAREALLESAAFGEHLADLPKPIISPGGSDSAMLDNVVDFVAGGAQPAPRHDDAGPRSGRDSLGRCPPSRRASTEYHASRWSSRGRSGRARVH